MKLTNRQREILEGLASDDDEKDLIQEGREVWSGKVRLFDSPAPGSMS